MVQCQEYSQYRQEPGRETFSPPLFAIYIEVLVVAIRKNVDIKGNTVRRRNTLYPDAIIVYLTSPEESVHKWMETIKEYGKFSGYKLYKYKYESLTTGKQVSQALKHGYKLKEDTKNLGINILKI